MKTSQLVTVLALSCAVPMALAQTQSEDHSAHHPPAATEGDAAAPSGHEHGSAKPDALQENMKSIESLMQQIHDSADPAQKRELLRQHLAALRQQMSLIVAQRAPMKMGMKDEGKSDASGGMMKDGMMKGGGMMMMHKKIEQRLDMIERLLQQEFEREAVEAELGER